MSITAPMLSMTKASPEKIHLLSIMLAARPYKGQVRPVQEALRKLRRPIQQQSQITQAPHGTARQKGAEILVYNSVLFQLRMEGIGHLQFTCKMYSDPQPPLQIPGVDDKDIELFVRDLLFNFTLEQALESLGEAGVLANVARLYAIVSCIPVYTELIRSVQELSEVVHKF